MNKKRDKFTKKLKNKYRVTFFNEETFQESRSFTTTKLDIFKWVTTILFALTFSIIFMIAYTPLRELIPGYPSHDLRQQATANSLAIDSLEYQINIRDKFIKNIKTIISGEIPEEPSQTLDTAIRLNQIKFKEYNHDSIFHDKIMEEKYSLSMFDNEHENKRLSDIHFFTPLHGNVSSKFKESPNHLGIDITAQKNSRISSVLDGTVVFSGWTTDSGYIIQIQHSNDLISAYKHNAELLKKTGEKVQAGEAIAILGNSGEVTTGAHLHFELWHKGVALDPQNYIDF